MSGRNDLARCSSTGREHIERAVRLRAVDTSSAASSRAEICSHSGPAPGARLFQSGELASSFSIFGGRGQNAMSLVGERGHAGRDIMGRAEPVEDGVEFRAGIGHL